MFAVGHNRTVDVPLFPGIFPNYVAPVVRQAADGDRELVNMNWASCCRNQARRHGASPTYATTRP
jgi:hypothetical protein